MKKLLYVGTLAVGLFASGCGADDQKASPVAADDFSMPSTTPAMAPTPPVSPTMTEASPSPWYSVTKAKVAVADTKIGKVLTGEMGRTLYLFEKDKDGKSTCSGACAVAWPPYITAEKPEAGDGAQADMLGTTTRDDGSMQVTYNKHPLYYYVLDKKAGDTLGNDIEAFGRSGTRSPPRARRHTDRARATTAA